MIAVIEDVVPCSYQEEIKKTLFGDWFPWFFKKDVTNANSRYSNNAPAFVHQFVIDGNINSRFWNAISHVPQAACKEVGVPFKDVSRAIGFLQLALNLSNLKNKIDPLHLDSTNPHYALIYYAIDSDGETLITSKKYDNMKGVEEGLRIEDYEILERVKPKQGRAVIFDGSYYHTATQPTASSVRCIINFNLGR